MQLHKKIIWKSKITQNKGQRKNKVAPHHETFANYKHLAHVSNEVLSFGSWLKLARLYFKELASTSHVKFCLLVVQFFRHISIKHSFIKSDMEFDQMTFALIIMELSTSLILANCSLWHYLLLGKCVISHREWDFSFHCIV